MFLNDCPDWAREGRDWPNRGASRFVRAGGLRWHVQVMGEGPVCLLLHGTGAATHSWRDVLPRLAERFTVVAPDLPGHGFTSDPGYAGLSLPGMARSTSTLLGELGVAPQVAVGHSAGAAVAARMALDGGMSPAVLVAFNGAFTPFKADQGPIYSTMARLLFVNPLVPRLFSWGAGDPKSVERLVNNTGSTLDESGVQYYTRLMRCPSHVQAAIGMMANWDLVPLMRDLPSLKAKLVLVASLGDKAIPPDQQDAVAAVVPGSMVIRQPDLGHLSHEERPDLAVSIIETAAREAGVMATP